MCGKFSDVMENWWSSFENLNVSSLVSCIREESVHSWRQWKLGVFWENQEGSWECQHHNKTALEQQMEKSSGYNRCINLSQRRTAGFHILLVLTNTIFSPDEVLELYDVWMLSETAGAHFCSSLAPNSRDVLCLAEYRRHWILTRNCCIQCFCWLCFSGPFILARRWPLAIIQLSVKTFWTLIKSRSMNKFSS